LIAALKMISYTFEMYENRFQKDIQIVIARYNEDMSYLKEGIFNGFDVILYNKGPKIEDPDILNMCTIVDLNNVGKIDHTILYHIIHSYHSLHDITLFISGSFYEIPEKRERVDTIMLSLNSNKDVRSELLDFGLNQPVLNSFYDFTMDQYVGRSASNRNPEVDNSMLPSPMRPFGEWYKHVFGDDAPINTIFYYGIFAVSKEDILKNPIEKYEELIHYVDAHPNPEAGHYLERSWTTLFKK
jgi:hypothetical protein